MVDTDEPEVEAPVELELLLPFVTAPVDTPVVTGPVVTPVETFVGPVFTDVGPVDTPTPTVELPDLLTPEEVLFRLALLPEFLTPDALDDPLLRVLVELPEFETDPPCDVLDELPEFFSELL